MGLIKQNMGQESWAERHVLERNKYWNAGQEVIWPFTKNNHKPMLVVLTGMLLEISIMMLGRPLKSNWWIRTCWPIDMAFNFTVGGCWFSVNFWIASGYVSSIIGYRLCIYGCGNGFYYSGAWINSIGSTATYISAPFDVVIIDLEKSSPVSDMTWSMQRCQPFYNAFSCEW